ncbi:MAG: HEAT repeat domain-containing protein [Candidatus Micrarchaeota archaeon]|nr:HEAT repeat domain-containing protein [Candidatus Micrarchaeota archaeon]
MKEQKKATDKVQKKFSFQKPVDEDSGDEIDKLVSLTFDENPKVREEVAKKLANHLSDPRAILALIDLSADKHESVKQTAKKVLENYQSPDKEAFSSLEKFFEKIHQSEDEQKEWEAQKSLMFPQVEKLFSSQVAKEKLLPSIEKLFSKRAKHQKHSQSQQANQPTLFELAGQESTVQNIESVESKKSSITEDTIKEKPTSLSSKEQDLDFPLPENIKEKLSSSVLSIPKLEEDDSTLESPEEEKLPLSFIDIYKFAFVLASNPATKASDLNKEKKRLLSLTKHNINLAFKLAIKKAKEEGGIDSFSSLKAGMKKLSTLPMKVVEVSPSQITKGKKQIKVNRILLSDGKTSLPLYLDEQKSFGIVAGDYITIKNCYVDYLIKNPSATKESEKGELCLFLSNNGSILISRSAKEE